jgi:hypothetical protein
MKTFVGSNIYSLVVGMYPILADDVKTRYYQSRFTKQAIVSAPSLYKVGHGNSLAENLSPRKAFLQGNKIIYSDAEGEVSKISKKQEDELSANSAQIYPVSVANLMNDAAGLVGGHQVAKIIGSITQGGLAAEEMVQSSELELGSREWSGIGEGEFSKANPPDLYNIITKQYHNVTIQRLESAVGHGVYGDQGREMAADIEDIRKAMKDKKVSMEEGYSAITARGLNYFRERAESTWNPMIRDARNTMNAHPTNNQDEKTRMARMRTIMLHGVVGPQPRQVSANAARMGASIAGDYVSNFASKNARAMTAQHLGNRSAMFGNGMLEWYAIGKYTFAAYGPFMMHDSGTNIYEYKVSQIDSSWIQNHNPSSSAQVVTKTVTEASSSARAQHAAYVTKSHDSQARTTIVGALVTAGIGGLTPNAGRLRPEINLVNASEQMSDKIHELVEKMSNLDTVPPKLMALIETHKKKYTINDASNMKSIWAAPYIGIYDQKLTSARL